MKRLRAVTIVAAVFLLIIVGGAVGLAVRKYRREHQTINVDLEDADLREAMEAIGRRVGRNILVDPSVNERVTISLNDFDWREAVDVMARMTKCNVEERGDVLSLTQRCGFLMQIDGDLPSALRLSAQYEGVNIVIDPAVKGSIAGRFNSIEDVAAASSLTVVREGSLVRILPR
jgi:type II secretory pathway component GspD/PulD (secretin)